MATIEIDGKTYEAQPGQMLIEVTDANGIDIPRFCYHKKLSVAANCRMCLVEVEKAPKPMPACATPIMDGMKVWTRSTKALTAQKAVMEFLLINHPLDCPICDQGGECELQDLAVGYGKSVSRYQEAKRVVFDKHIGPLIATEMTRCIHCTRCVRFGVEIAGIQELGAPGRGEHTHITTYLTHSVDSELSGNVIDLCPVGALTAKPSRFSARSWEMQQYPSIAPHDSLGSHVDVHVLRQQVVRVVPRENPEINEVWLADRDRFSYEALTASDRLQQPLIKKEGQWQATDWETALQFSVEGFKKVINTHKPQAMGALTSPAATIEELFLCQKIMRGLGTSNIDHRLQQSDFSDQADAPLFPYLGQSISELEDNDTILVIGSHLRKALPLINHRLRKVVLGGGQVGVINPLDYQWNFPLAEKCIVTPEAWVATLAGVAKALSENQRTLLPASAWQLLDNVTVTEEHQRLAQWLVKGQKRSVLVGDMMMAHPQFATLRSLAAIIAKLSASTLGYLPLAANSAGAWLAGALPHRLPNGQPVNEPGLDALAMVTEQLKAYLLLGVEPELDSYQGEAALARLRQADWVVALTGYRSALMEQYANVLLPIALFPETSGTFVNLTGQWQSFNGVVPPVGEARPGWKILRVMGNLFNLGGFEYMASTQIRDELCSEIGNKQSNNKVGWRAQIVDQPMDTQGELQRITELPIYSVDMMVRRAPALQQTADAQQINGIHLHPQTAARLSLQQGDNVRVQQGDSGLTLPVVLDERVPLNGALVYGMQKDNVNLGAWYGAVNIRGPKTEEGGQ